VQVTPPRVDPAAPPSPEAMIRDPKLLIAFIDQHPGRLDAKAMSPPLVLTLTRLLVDADRVFDAERLLSQARALWPDDWEVTRAWVRVVLGLGRATAALQALEAQAGRRTDDPSLLYLQGNAWLQIRPRTEATLRGAFAAYARLIGVAPEYRDADGVTAAQIGQAVSRMGEELGLDAAAIAAASSPPVVAPASAPLAPSTP
jgi:predicted Zn-dependent protease